ncbi:MAG: RimK/LysX family protein, partial [Methanothrix sp.]|nr:RimK/LysX family protein [Methanothrix sp.]
MRFHLPERAIRLRGISLVQRTVSPPHVRLSAFPARAPWAALLAVLFLIELTGAQAGAKEKIRLGAVENVALLPWGVVMPARIDTGAATSSLDARNLVIKGKTVEFDLPPQYGGRRITLPLYKWKTIKTAEALDRRPVVIMELCIGSRRVRTHVNLNDRSNVKYPLIIGRNTLSHDFVI